MDQQVNEHQTCPRCNGKGTITRWTWERNKTTLTAVTCPTCKGKGYTAAQQKERG